MALRPCLGFGAQRCVRLTGRADGRCDDHARQAEAARRPDRPSARQRGYDAAHQRQRAAVLAESTVCWLCGHDGADQVDHVVAVSNGGTSTLGNLRPAHGTLPCPTCDRRCNQQRGSRDAQ